MRLSNDGRENQDDNSSQDMSKAISPAPGLQNKPMRGYPRQLAFSSSSDGNDPRGTRRNQGDGAAADVVTKGP